MFSQIIDHNHRTRPLKATHLILLLLAEANNELKGRWKLQNMPWSNTFEARRRGSWMWVDISSSSSDTRGSRLEPRAICTLEITSPYPDAMRLSMTLVAPLTSDILENRGLVNDKNILRPGMASKLSR